MGRWPSLAWRPWSLRGVPSVNEPGGMRLSVWPLAAETVGGMAASRASASVSSFTVTRCSLSGCGVKVLPWLMWPALRT